MSPEMTKSAENLRGHRMKRVLRRMLDETEFLSPYGVRALSRSYAGRPYVFDMGGTRHDEAAVIAPSVRSRENTRYDPEVQLLPGCSVGTP